MTSSGDGHMQPSAAPLDSCLPVFGGGGGRRREGDGSSEPGAEMGFLHPPEQHPASCHPGFICKMKMSKLFSSRNLDTSVINPWGESETSQHC